MEEIRDHFINCNQDQIQKLTRYNAIIQSLKLKRPIYLSCRSASEGGPIEIACVVRGYKFSTLNGFVYLIENLQYLEHCPEGLVKQEDEGISIHHDNVYGFRYIKRIEVPLLNAVRPAPLLTKYLMGKIQLEFEED